MEETVKTLERIQFDNFAFIKNKMKEKKLTYKDLGKILGVSKQSIHKSLNNKNITLTNLLKVCKIIEEYQFKS